MVLKAPKMRMTRQRKVILDVLRQMDHHPSADEIYELVRKQLPRISLGTVYRNLEVLSELGEVRKIEHSGSLKRFDGHPHNHYHIRCMRCDRVEDAPIGLLEDLENKLTGETSYQVMGHRLEFIGLCERCASKIPTHGHEKALIL